MIIEKILKLRESQISQWPVRSNYASSIGHECLRYLVLQRTRWQEKVLHGVELQTIFNEGNLHEVAVLRDLQDAGFTIIEQQRVFEWKQYQISGRIDAKILNDGIAIPLEIKSCSPFVFQGINSAEDLYNSKYHHVRGYPCQMILYLLMDEKEYGYFLFKNKVNGFLKEIRIDLDYDLGESLLKKAEAINRHVDNDTLPDCIEYDEMICGGCGYLHICLPEIKRDSMIIEDEPEVEYKLARLDELKPYISEHRELDREVKALFRERDKIMLGDYYITGKWVERKGFTVKDSKYWKVKIDKIKED